MLLLAFGNKARNGKDTAAAAIQDYFDQKLANHIMYYGEVPSKIAALPPIVKIFRFADGVYEEARTKYGMTEKNSVLLQQIGHGRRQSDPEYWIRQCFEKIESEKDSGRLIAIIADMRYRNEAEFVKRRGGFLVNVTRINPDGKPYIAQDRSADHPSEIELDDCNWDYRIVSKEAALTGEYAVTLVEYLRGIGGLGAV